MCETWDQTDREGEECSLMLPFPAWLEGAGAAAALSVLGEEGSIPLAQLISLHGSAKLFLTCSACDVPRHAAMH